MPSIIPGYTPLTDDKKCIDNDAEQCTSFSSASCKETFGYESTYHVCKSNGKDYQEFHRYCDYADNFCNETASGWATVKMGSCDFKFQ